MPHWPALPPSTKHLGDIILQQAIFFWTVARHDCPFFRLSASDMYVHVSGKNSTYLGVILYVTVIYAGLFLRMQINIVDNKFRRGTIVMIGAVRALKFISIAGKKPVKTTFIYKCMYLQIFIHTYVCETYEIQRNLPISVE